MFIKCYYTLSILLIVFIIQCSTQEIIERSSNEYSLNIFEANCSCLGKSISNNTLYSFKCLNTKSNKLHIPIPHKIIHSIEMNNISFDTIEFNRSISFDEIEQLKRNNHSIFEINQITYYHAYSTVSISDSNKLLQPALSQIHCLEGWNINQGSANVEIAVIDTAFNSTHNNLIGKILDGWAFSQPCGDTYDGLLTSNLNWDDEGHGTHVAGIAAGSQNQGYGIFGVCPSCSLRPYKISANCQLVFRSDMIQSSILKAADNNLDGNHRVVINCSFGGNTYSQDIKDAVDYALMKGAIIISAMGNETSNLLNYPAGHNGVIGVGAVDYNDNLAIFSTKGYWMSVVAPGTDILSCYNLDNRGFTFRSGTSQATPFVAGLCGLVLSKNLSLSPLEVRSIIEDTSDDLGTPGFDQSYGWGRINVNNALNSSIVNHYGSLVVGTKVNGSFMNNVWVVITDSDGRYVDGCGSSSGGIGNLKYGYAYFLCLREGNYTVSVTYSNKKDTKTISINSAYKINSPLEIILDAI